MPKAVLYSELCQGKHNRSGPIKRFKDQLKQQLTAAEIDNKIGKLWAADKNSWHFTARKAGLRIDNIRHQTAEERRRWRKGTVPAQPPTQASTSHKFQCPSSHRMAVPCKLCLAVLYDCLCQQWGEQLITVRQGWELDIRQCWTGTTMDIIHTWGKLEKLAGDYISDTLSCIHTVQGFCDRHSKWLLQRETELEMMRGIKDRAERLHLTTDHISKSEHKRKAFGEYMWSKATQMTAESRAQELEKELGAVLKDSLEGLEKLTLFLEAVEKLAVTSLLVFREENPLCRLSKETSTAAICSIILATKRACPLLIHFKRDNNDFFLPSLVNVDALIFQLDKYTQVSQELCVKLQKRQMTYVMDVRLDFAKETMQNMLDHLNQLTNIRMDPHFRMTFLFRGAALRFIGLFSQRSSRMREFLEALEEGAVQLDRMKMGVNISSVAGSTVGLAGGVMSIVGLALAPVTAGLSLTLTLVGVGLGVTSGVNGLATGIAELSVNSYRGKKVNEILQSYKEDVGMLLECLKQVANSTKPEVVPGVIDAMMGAGKMGVKILGVSRKIDAIVDGASALTILKNEGLVSSVVRGAGQEGKSVHYMPNVVTDLSDLGQLAKGTSITLTKSARAGFIALNSIFMGLDILFICKDSISLAKGSKSNVSKVIRGRADLWKIELDAWERIHNSLCIGIWRYKKSMEVLERPFYS
ncbi:hypothetical protein AAFF_G00177010 [Aldrovandia affinis]|uniref:Apolipoprotein L3 n=1 Tax=Aldrovandia affinis TaxID=143900 RepID=A0AAD7RLF6_9TELE|nr:hypothetical protein AAFF_G00177010 [Aldrovandia affinis]